VPDRSVREQVGEIDAIAQLHVDGDRLAPVVAHFDVVPEAAADVAAPEQQQRAVQAVGVRAGARCERRRERRERGDRQRFQRGAVHLQLQPRQQPGVDIELALQRSRPHVAGPTGKAERRLVHQGDRFPRIE
jgi:hypothetical protein